jgi:hypothetical protein
MSTPTDPNAVQVNIDQRMRTVRILWFALLTSIAMYYLFTIFAGRPDTVQPNSTLSLALLAVGMLTVVGSLPIKSKLVNQAIERRQVQHVQQGYIAAWAICELAALLALLDFFLTNDPYFYVLFIIAAIGDLIHYPRREHFLSASVTPPINL